MPRTVGIEEELLIVDHESGRPLSLVGRLLGDAGVTPVDRAGDTGAASGDEPDGTVGLELQQEQLETNTSPRTSLADLENDVRRWRDVVAVAARDVGARIVASGTSPLPVTPHLVRDARYEWMAARFGLTATEQLACACHVHVAVRSDDEAVTVLNRIRVWLPALLAISANSPFWQGQDSHYASYRSQTIVRWPSTGPTEVFASGEAYRSLVADMVASGVLLDERMVYFDARASTRYPTVEIRVPDVCLDVRHAVLIAALCRGLVDTAAEEHAAGQPVPPVPAAMLRLANWQAAREGVDGALLDPVTYRKRPAQEVLADLLEHVRPALEAVGDGALVEERLPQVVADGNGARRQRNVFRRTNRLVDVVADLARVTAGQEC